MQRKYRSKGFVVLAFPSNDFRQELETNEEISAYLEDKFPDADFPVFGLTSLRENQVFLQLRSQLPDQPVQHNFYKYLVGRDGVAVDLFTKKEDPIAMEYAIEELLRERN